MASNFQLAIQGNLQDTLASRRDAYLRGLRAGTVDSTDSTKNRMRSDVSGAGFPRRLATTIRGDVYPARGLAYEPTGLVYSKSPKILAGHTDGGTIKPNKAESLLVPISGSPGDRPLVDSDESTLAAFKRRYGHDSLTLVKRPGKNPIYYARLKVDQAGSRYRAYMTKNQRNNDLKPSLTGQVSVPVFTLVKSVRLKKRLNLREIMAKANREHPARLAFHVQKELAHSEDETGLLL